MVRGDPTNGYPEDGVWVDDIAYDDDDVEDAPNIHGDVLADVIEDVTESHHVTEDAAPLDANHDIQRQVMEAMDRGDALHRDADGHQHVEDGDDLDSETVDGLHRLYEQATTPLYTGSKTNVVSATVVIMNMCVVFGVNNKFTSQLLRYLSEDLLPVGNKLPNSHYAASKTNRRQGLNYNNIHACPDGCVLYEDERADVQVCPKCSKSRWMDGTNSIPAKVIRHFPLVPRLKRM
jgi:hypothetical protein